MDKRRRTSVPAVGGSSLLVMFAVLCLTVFALLALSTAQADGRLSQASARAVSDYYEADCRAETIFAQLRSGRRPQGVTEREDVYYFACAVSDTQVLRVAVENCGGDWRVLQWQTVSTAVWEEDDSLELWDGELQ